MVAHGKASRELEIKIGELASTESVAELSKNELVAEITKLKEENITLLQVIQCLSETT